MSYITFTLLITSHFIFNLNINFIHDFNYYPSRKLVDLVFRFLAWMNEDRLIFIGGFVGCVMVCRFVGGVLVPIRFCFGRVSILGSRFCRLSVTNRVGLVLAGSGNRMLCTKIKNNHEVLLTNTKLSMLKRSRLQLKES